MENQSLPGPRPRSKRKPGHDYSDTWAYHLTFQKHPSCPAFSTLVGGLTTPTPETVDVKNSPLGTIISYWIRALPTVVRYSRVYQYKIMPDHIHVLLKVTVRLEEHLSRCLRVFKWNITNEWRRKSGDSEALVFDRDYDDRIMYPYRDLKTVCDYIKENPYRLAVRMAYPDFFRRAAELTVCGKRFAAYGNLQLLDNPFKEAVVVHRADSPAFLEAKENLWAHCYLNGGVLVSAFISQTEKRTREGAESAQAKMILISNRRYGDRDKPARHDFNLCCEGRLLILTPLDDFPPTEGRTVSREQCKKMNALAELLAGAPSGAHAIAARR